jgi:hypothetical protein
VGADVEVRRGDADRHVVDVDAVGHDLRGEVERDRAGADRTGHDGGVFIAAAQRRGEVHGLGLSLGGHQQNEEACNGQGKTSHHDHSL